MTEGQFLSRRELREAQQAGREPAVEPEVQAQPSVHETLIATEPQISSEVQISPEPQIVAEPQVQALVSEFNFPPLTKSQLVEMGRITDQDDVTKVSTAVTNVQIAPATVAQIATSGVINPYAPKVPAVEVPAAPAVANLQTESEPAKLPAAVYQPVLAEAEEPITSQIQLFDVSPNLNIEPQTASIIIDNFEPLDAISIAISETGELLKTGSIELPNISTNTGEIATILDAAQVDEAIAQDSVNGYVSTIAPLRASGVVNTAGKIGIMPTKNAKGQSAGFAVLTLSLLMISVGGLVLAAYMLGFLK